jgi:hypothetical protein
MTGRSTAQLLGLFLESQHAVDHVAGALDQGVGGRRWLDRVRGAIEESLAELTFEFLQAPTESGLRERVFARRLHETPEPIERLEML